MTTLKNLVDETTNIKNEIKTCHTDLKNNLIGKGVKCNGNEKFSDLIDKIKNISSLPKRGKNKIQTFSSTRTLNMDAFNFVDNNTSYSARNGGYFIVKGEGNYVYIVSDLNSNNSTKSSITKYNLSDDTYQNLYETSTNRIFPALNNSYLTAYVVFYHNNTIRAIYNNKMAIFDLETLASTSISLDTSLSTLSEGVRSVHIIDNVLYFGVYKVDLETNVVTKYINTSVGYGYTPIGNSQALSMFGSLVTSSYTTVSTCSLHKIDIDTGVRTNLDVSHIRPSYNHVCCVNKNGDVVFVCGKYYYYRSGETRTEYSLDNGIYYDNSTSTVHYLSHIASLNNDGTAHSNYGIYSDGDENFHFILNDRLTARVIDFLELKIEKEN